MKAVSRPALPEDFVWPALARGTMPEVGRYAPSETALAVRFADVDMMHVVHHSAYLHWFEQIRFKFMHDVLGVRFAQLVEAGVALPLTACEVQYRRAFVFGDRPIGYARAQVYRQAQVTLHYAIYKGADGELAATGTSTHCFVGTGHKLLLNWPGFFADAMSTAHALHPACLIGRGEVQP